MASFEQRGNSVRAVISLPGRKKVSQTFDSMAEARAWAAKAEQKKDVLQTHASDAGQRTVGELFEVYEDAVAAHTDGAKFNKLRLRKWAEDPIASLTVAACATHDVNAWIHRRLQTGKVSPSTVNRELNLMSGAFAYAVKSLRWISTNPCHGAARPERGRPRKRALLTEAEIQAICISTGFAQDPQLKTKTARVGACFLLSLETGMRSGELLRLKPEHYYRDQRYLHVAASEKGGRKGARSGRSTVDPSRNIPLTERAIELLDQLLLNIPEQVPNPDDGLAYPPYIVGLSDKQRDALWRKARDQAGVEDLHFHDTKHEAATRLSKFVDVLALSHAIGTKDVRLLRDTYYNNDAARVAKLLPQQLAPKLK